MGGDRDGNPFVTPETTRDVVITARLAAINVYFESVEQLMFELSNWRCNEEMRVSLQCCFYLCSIPCQLVLQHPCPDMLQIIFRAKSCLTSGPLQ